MTSLFPIIISALSGAVAANFAGLALRNFSLGYIRNTIVGIIGGVIVSIIVSSSGLSNLGTVLNGVICGGAGGGVLLLISGLIRNLIKK